MSMPRTPTSVTSASGAMSRRLMSTRTLRTPAVSAVNASTTRAATSSKACGGRQCAASVRAIGSALASGNSARATSR
jgi:hypothetical protein